MGKDSASVENTARDIFSLGTLSDLMILSLAPLEATSIGSVKTRSASLSVVQIHIIPPQGSQNWGLDFLAAAKILTHPRHPDSQGAGARAARFSIIAYTLPMIHQYVASIEYADLSQSLKTLVGVMKAYRRLFSLIVFNDPEYRMGGSGLKKAALRKLSLRGGFMQKRGKSKLVKLRQMWRAVQSVEATVAFSTSTLIFSSLAYPCNFGFWGFFT